MKHDDLESVSDELRVHLLEPRRIASSSDDSRHVAAATNAACGDRLELHGCIVDGRLDLTFRAQGCWGVVVSASLLCEVLTGRTLDEALAHDHRAAIAAAGGLPRSRQHAVALFERVLLELVRTLQGRM